MKSIKKPTYLMAITLVIAGLVIASSATAMISTQSSNEDIADSLALSQSQPIKYTKEISSVSRGGSQVTNEAYNEYHPSVAYSPTGIFYAMADASEDGSIWQPTLYASDETGASWERIAAFTTVPGSQFVSLDSNSVGTYGTFGESSEGTGLIHIFQADDLAGLSVYWNYGDNGYSNLFYNDMAAYNDPEPNATNYGWIVALTGDISPLYGVPMVFYREFGPNAYGIMSPITGKTGYVHAVNTVDQEQNRAISVYDREDGTGLYVRVLSLTWSYSESAQYWTHRSSKNIDIAETQFQVKYPSVAANNNNVMIVAQKINGASNDIICYYSTDGLSTYNRVMIADSTDNEMYPQIESIAQNVAICTYFKNNVLYFKVTSDGGATWGTETQVSDSQANAEYRGQGMCNKAGDVYTVWEDTRNGNVDIYFDKLPFHVQTPDIQIGTVAGGIGKVTMEVKNNGDGDATDVSWSISVKGGILNKIDVTTTGIISSLTASGTVTVQTDKFLFGLGVITIQLAADPVTGSKTGTQLLFFTKI